MAISGPFYRAPEPARDWTWRLPPNRAGVEADPGMEIRPPDGSYSMRRVGEENLSQMPGQEVGGWLPASGPNALGPQLMQQTYVDPMARNALLAGPFDEMADYPKSTARVPQYSMRDTPYYQLIPPITGRETTAPVMSNEARRDADVQRQMAALSQQMAEMQSRPGFTMSMLMPLLKQHQALADSSPTVLQARRDAAGRKAVPDDVAAIMRGIENAGRR